VVPTPYFPKTDKALIDRWTLGHLSVGAIMRLLGVPRPYAYVLSIAFELSENYLKLSFPKFFSPVTTPDTFPHFVVDALATITGYEAASLLPPERENFNPASGKHQTIGP
jgi:hypothetical protein